MKQLETSVLHFDAGDAFQKDYTVSDAARKQVEAASMVYLKVFKKLNLAAYNIGDRDLALGIPLLKKLARKAAFPFLSSNILDARGAPVFEPSALIEAAGLKIAVIGAVTTLFVNREQIGAAQKIEIADPAKTVAKEIARRKAEGAQLFVLLCHLNPTEMEAVAKKNPELSFILGGQEMRFQFGLKHYGKTLAAEAFMRGKNLSVLKLHIHNNKLSFGDRDYKSALQRRIASLDGQIKSRQQYIKQAKTDPRKKQNLEYFERNLVQLKTEHQLARMDLEDAADVDPESSFVTWELKGMDTSLKDETAVAKIVADYRAIHPDPTQKKPLPKPRSGR